MPTTISDRVLWLSIGAGIFALTRAVSYGLHHVYNLTEVAPAPDSPRAVAQGTEDDIPLPSLQVLATQHPNLEIRKAAAAIVTTRVLTDRQTVRRILADYKKPDGAPDQRAARNAIQLIRSTNGIDLEDWEEEQQRRAAEDENENPFDESGDALAAAAAVEVGFDTTTAGGGGGGGGEGGGRRRNARRRLGLEMRREIARRYWTMERVRDPRDEDWGDTSDDNYGHADDTSVESDNDDDDNDDDDQDPTITVDPGQLADSNGDTAPAAASSAPQPSRRAGEFEALPETDVAALVGDGGLSQRRAADGSDAASGEIRTIWDRQRNRRANGLGPGRRGDASHVVDDVPRPHGWTHLRTRSSRDSEEEVARRRVRREAVVVNDGDRPISQEDIIQRPLQRRSY